MGKLTKLFDRAADILVPKEIAGILGPASMMFAGPLGMPTALLLGQLGSAKMHSGKLDPYTALGTIASAQAYKFRNPEGYGKFSLKNVGKGIGSAFDQNPNTKFMDAFQGMDPRSAEQIEFAKAKEDLAFDKKTAQDVYKQDVIAADGDPTKLAEAKTMYENKLETLGDVSDLTDNRDFFMKADDISQSLSSYAFPGFGEDPLSGDIDLGKALVTLGSVTTLSQITAAGEALKKQKAKNKREEGQLWKEWFEGYARVSGGKSYVEDNPMADPEIVAKYNEFMKANGGRIGYNTGGGIMEVAPGVPQGMELDYRDSGGFIPMGAQEKKDDVPAVLAKNEFVLTCDEMKGLDKLMGGAGDPRAAAKYMYNMMDNLEAMV